MMSDLAFSFDGEAWSIHSKQTTVVYQMQGRLIQHHSRSACKQLYMSPHHGVSSKKFSLWWCKQCFPKNKELRLLENVLMRSTQKNVMTRFVLNHCVSTDNCSTGSAGGGGGSSEGRGHWQGSVPYLCIIKCIIQDNVKCSFHTRADVTSEHGVDAFYPEVIWVHLVYACSVVASYNSELTHACSCCWCFLQNFTCFWSHSHFWISFAFNPGVPVLELNSNCSWLWPCNGTHSCNTGKQPRIEDTFTFMRSDLLPRIASCRNKQSGHGKNWRDQEDDADIRRCFLYEMSDADQNPQNPVWRRRLNIDWRQQKSTSSKSAFLFIKMTDATRN